MANTNIFEPNKTIFNVTDQLRNKILQLEKDHHIPFGYLKTALALHLPRFTEKEIYADGYVELQTPYEEAKRLAKLLENKISSLPSEIQEHLMKEDKHSKVKHGDNGKIIEVDTEGRYDEIEFRRVDHEMGYLYQEKLHYIGHPREDTLYHFGLFRKNERYPYAYCAYSVLDRKYLKDALPFHSDMQDILVLTRSYSYNNSPINSMSMMFGLSMAYIQEKHPNKFKGVITAINPNTLFKGTVFKGSAFFTFATVPFMPTYYRGDYITRKVLNELDREGNLNEKYISGSELECPPTIWMGHGFDKESFTRFRDCHIVNVTKKSYIAG